MCASTTDPDDAPAAEHFDMHAVTPTEAYRIYPKLVRNQCMESAGRFDVWTHKFSDADSPWLWRLAPGSPFESRDAADKYRAGMPSSGRPVPFAQATFVDILPFNCYWVRMSIEGHCRPYSVWVAIGNTTFNYQVPMDGLYKYTLYHMYIGRPRVRRFSVSSDSSN
jgi:hypothetical protein